ncbi:MAG: UDP-2,3-diacylglucosamine diphosphatase [Planctomycetota bacterium]|nr:UDP-2,3-diacylglucosamine diphosphatase [Planctomycetota bacterium]MCX8039852.1 UDP-2,3-diacylglucosamine diphosphatase [Planctomycetota bacterium]MDW8372817.1 UDP-2,3-diacylglucosamine diphosphatase [Planctomycetota bacterium]
MGKRRVDIVVISDLHLGTAACHAAELNAYLKSLDPGMIVLNGDIIDLWDFRKGYWPEAHTKVVRRLLKFAVAGVPVHYVTGNHDGALRRFTPLGLGAISLVDRLELTLDGQRHWFLHGDAFDLALGTGRLASWIGTWSYDALLTLGVGINALRRRLGLDRVSLVSAVREGLPAAQRHVARFEECCARAAAARGCDVVIAGHIHVPAQRRFEFEGRSIAYLNSGDWVEHLSALEYRAGQWQLVRWHELLAAGQVTAPLHEETVAVAASAA